MVHQYFSVFINVYASKRVIKLSLFKIRIMATVVVIVWLILMLRLLICALMIIVVVIIIIIM